MNYLDILITRAINEFAGMNGSLDVLVISLTFFGVPCMVFWTVLQWWSGDNRAYRRHVAATSGLAFLLGLLINQIILLFIQRVRPYDAGLTQLLIAPTADPSFPSDHATACFSICFSFLIKGLKREARLLALVSMLICLSRVYVGTHYFTDVLGGMMTALVATMIVASLYRFNSRIDQKLTRLM